MKAVIGLGNPEIKYQNTRHNTGFIVVDKLLSYYGVSLCDKFQSFFGKKDDLLFLLPKTYMNLSGNAVIELVNFYKLSARDILIIFDDATLPLGTLRFRKDGSHGGHNGIKSIINSLSASEFDRLKVGVGPIPEHIPIDAFVLGKFNSDELKTMDKISDICVDAVQDWLKDDMTKLQSKYNKQHL